MSALEEQPKLIRDLIEQCSLANGTIRDLTDRLNGNTYLLKTAIDDLQESSALLEAIRYSADGLRIKLYLVAGLCFLSNFAWLLWSIR